MKLLRSVSCPLRILLGPKLRAHVKYFAISLGNSLVGLRRVTGDIESERKLSTPPISPP